MRRMISTPTFLAKSRRQPKANTFKPTDPNENTIFYETRGRQSTGCATPAVKPRLRSDTLSHPELKKKLSVHPVQDTPTFVSPPKQRKRNPDAIVDTPSRFAALKSSSYFNSIASLANRMSLRKKAQR